jgi:diguanylate cyclase (GGDEF)-like protein
MAPKVLVLLADFDPQRGAESEHALASGGCKVERVSDGATALEACTRKLPDVLVMEAFLPRRNGFDVLKSLKADARTSAIRVVLLLDEGDDYGRSRARLCGADTIMSRPFGSHDLLQEVLRPSAAQQPAIDDLLADMDARAKAENPLVQYITDPSTGLFNKAYTDLKLAEECKKARRFQQPLTCLLIGLDDGGQLAEPRHAELLRTVVNDLAGLLLCESRDIDHVSRYGTEEFLLLLPHTDQAGASAMARRVLSSIANRGLAKPDGTPLTGSAGIAGFLAEDEDAAQGLVTRGREALKVSRHWGGNRFTIHSEHNAPQTGQ